MANHVRSRFTLIGNESVQKYAGDLIDTFLNDLEETGSTEDLSAVGRIIYGLSGDEAYLGVEQVGSKWVMPDSDSMDGGLAFQSAWEPPNLLQDYILKEISQLDPRAIVYMEYEDEGPGFVGARYAVMKNGEIDEHEFRENLSGVLVVSEDDLEDAIEENNETEDYEDVITCDDVFGILAEQKEMAFENLQGDNEWIGDEVLKASWDVI